jgi:phage gp29-like protein
MGRNKMFRPQRFVKMPLASGGSMNFYEPDQLLSEQVNSKAMLKQEIAIRETAWSYYRVLGFLPNPSETLRKLNKDIAEYKYLLEDSHVNGCLESRFAGTLSLKWTLDRNNCAVRQYQTINAILTGMPMMEILHEILYSVFFGYLPIEIIWEKVGGNLLPKEIAPKDCDWFRFSDLNEGRYLTKRNMVTGEPIPNYKFIMARFRASYERPYGRPLGSVVYWPVKFRHAGLRFWTEFAEKFGQPWIKAEYPLGTQAARVMEMLDMLDKTVQDGVVAYPSEFKIETVDVNKTASGDIFNQFVEHMNEEIAIGILGQTLTTKAPASGAGSFALGKVHEHVRGDIVNGDKQIIENVFNTLISWIYELNYASSDIRPVFKMIDTPAPTVDDAQMAQYLTQCGVKFTPNYFQNRFNMIPDDEFTVGPAQGSVDAGLMMSTDSSGNHPFVAGADTKSMDNDVSMMTHESRDTATNQPTYSSTKESFNRLTKR